MATRLPARFAAARRLSITFLWLLKSPWEKLRRAIFIPARIICSMTSLDSDAGPIVQTILVLCVGKAIFIPPALHHSPRRTDLPVNREDECAIVWSGCRPTWLFVSDHELACGAPSS